MEHSNVTQVFALVVGAVYLLVALIGFAVTGLEINALDSIVRDGDDAIFGLFDVNVFHNVVHLALGLGFVVASRLNATLCQGIVMGASLVLLLAAVLGFLNELQILSINAGTAADNFLHLVLGSVGLLFGIMGANQTDELYSRRAARA